MIEVHPLFGLPREQIHVVIHRQSIVHSLVEFVDGSVLAQLGLPDMRVPIAVALAHCLFNVPLAIWILEGFMSGIPKEIDETAFLERLGTEEFGFFDRSNVTR